MTPTVRTSILRMVASAFPQLVYGYPRTYVVTEVRADKRLDLAPPPDAQHLPELQNVEQWSLGGALVSPVAGTQVLVGFRDSDPSRPFLVGFEPGPTPLRVSVDSLDTVTIGETAELVELGSGSEAPVGTAVGRVLRYGDTIQLPPPISAPYVLIPGTTAPIPHVSKVKA